MKMSNTIGALAKALSNAQKEIKGATVNANNPYYNSSYADLSAVVDAAKPLSSNDIAYTQQSSFRDGAHIIETVLIHSSGEWISGEFPIFSKDLQDPQKHKSAHTLLRRAALMAAIGLAEIDDDGNKSIEKDSNQKYIEKDSNQKHQENKKEEKGPVNMAAKVTKKQIDFLLNFSVKQGFQYTELMNMVFSKYNIKSLEEMNMQQLQIVLEGLEYKKG